MIPTNNLFEKTLELPDKKLQPYEIVQLARKKGLIKTKKETFMPDLKEGEYAVPMKNKSGIAMINPIDHLPKVVMGIILQVCLAILLSFHNRMLFGT